MTLNVASILRESATRNPGADAIKIGPMTMSYGEVHTMVQRLAGGLKALGLTRGQHVALMLPNVPHFTIAYYAVHYAGGVVVPLNVLLTPDEVAYHLEDSDAVALIAWEGFAEAASGGFARVDTCKHLIVAKADPKDVTADEGTYNFTALVAGSDPVTDLPDTMPDDTAVVLYTSGTTGHPKGAELTHFNLFYNADYSAHRLILYREDDVGLVTLPLFHSFGQTVLQNGLMRVGGCLVLLPRFDPKSAFELMQAHGVTIFAGVPTMYFALLNYPEADGYDLSKLRACVSGGSAMPVEVMRAFDAKYEVNVLEGYGLSETSPVASFNVLHLPKKAGSIGIPIRGVEFRLVDEEGAIISESGKAGEIEIKGHNVMKGYYKRPEVNAQQIVDGWFKTGDIGTRDDEGFYFIVDRKKDMIIRGGFNVYPREIEEVLYAFPGVTEAAVVGVPHESHGEEVKAIVAFRPGEEKSPEEVIAYCQEHLAKYKYPRLVEVRAELPKGPTGKILKRVLRDES